MEQRVGIWIDHRHAVIIALNNGGEHVEVVESDAENPPKMEGGARAKTPWGPQDTSAETRNERQFRHQLDRYYRNVIDRLKGVDSIFIFGPGLAKGELKKELAGTHILRDRIAGVETADKMTQPQMAAKVREFYGDRK